MNKKPKKRSPEFKFQVAIEAIEGEGSINQIASKYELHPKQVRRWRDKLLDEGRDLFIHKATLKSQRDEPGKDELLHVINQLTRELDFLKKKLGRGE